MSTQFFLEETDIDTLINLLLRSQQSRTREALCVSIGIDPKRLSFIRDSSDSDFFLLLIRYLNEIGEQEALCKLCCKELIPVFHHGKYAPILSEIAGKLNCNQRLSQNSTNNQQPTVLSSSPASRVGVNPFNQLAKNKLITGSAIILIGLVGFFIVPSNSPIVRTDSLEVYADSTKGVEYTNKEDNFVQVKFNAQGKWLAIPENEPGISDDAKGYLSPKGDPNFKPKTTPCRAPLGALIIRGEDGKCKAYGEEGSFELKPRETVYFLMNDVSSRYDDNKGSIKVNLSISKN